MHRIFPAALVLAAISVFPVSASPYKTIKGTTVICTNGLTCEISLKAKIEGQKLYSFALSRTSAPDSPILIKLRMSDPLATGSDVVILADGAEAARIAASDFDNDSDMGEYVAKDQSRGKALLSLMRDSSDLEVQYRTDSDQKAGFSLAGVAGAMLFFDEAQNRIGTVDAVEKYGDKPSPVPTARDITDIASLPEAIRRDFVDEAARCSFTDAKRFSYSQGFATRVNENAELFVLPCGEGGAYNQPYVLYQVGQDYSEPVYLATMSPDGPIATSNAYNVDWDDTTKTLTAFFKGRGIGDCGSLDTWGVSNIDGEFSLYLKESRVKDDCDGKDDPAESWPQLWPPQ